VSAPEIHPSASVAPGARIGAGCRVGPFCVVGPEAVLEEGVELASHVVVEGATTLGVGVRVLPFAAVGTPPLFGPCRQPPLTRIPSRIGSNSAPVVDGFGSSARKP